MKKPVLKAGGIVVRRKNDAPTILIVTAKKGKHWILPKGKVKRSEKPSAAAVRETREEGRVTGRVVSRAGVATYTADGRRNRVEYFLIRFTRETRNGGEDRERRWCTVRQTIHLLSHASTRRLVRESRKEIAALAK